MAEHPIIPHGGAASEAGRASALLQGRLLDAASAVALALAFLALALARLGEPGVPVFDEVFHARAGLELAAGRPPTELSHPPLAKDVVAGCVRLLGAAFDPATRAWTAGETSPYPPAAVWAWRAPSALAGALAVATTFALARLLGLGRPAAAAAAGLLALDGCFFVHARLAMTNVYETLFVLVAAAAAWRAEAGRAGGGRADGWLGGAGLAMGLALACRWSAAGPYVALGAWLAWRRRAAGGPALLRLAAAWTVAPALAYAAAWAPLVAVHPGGGGLLAPGAWRAAFLDAQLKIYEFHAYLREVHAAQSAWWTWPFMARPAWYWLHVTPARVFEAIWAIGNAAVWWPSLPALLAAAWAGRRRPALGYVALLGLGAWLAWAVQPRALTFMHYYLPTIPFACVALAAIAEAWWRGEGLAGGPAALDRPAARVAVGALGLAAVAWFAFYYPLLTALPLPEAEVGRRVWFGAAWL